MQHHSPIPAIGGLKSALIINRSLEPIKTFYMHEIVSSSYKIRPHEQLEIAIKDSNLVIMSPK